LAEHSDESERGKAYAAHFALTHACWLVTYPAIGHAAANFGTPLTFSIAGIVCLLIVAAAYLSGRGSNKPHIHSAAE
jgi:MFS transporter, NRE family, putaive nickel resistance protein